ncbi:ABC transporter permease [Corynebacterium auris]|uniref:ABC transporter permease n=1 Tax=Corynebacterium auris TaxID=44750 RepID=UPI0025B5A73B|nr:ABC transporter permease [Corynebacterium auris]WJY67567.1 ABC-2 family transporter protein [Corynebacterium auris]
MKDLPPYSPIGAAATTAEREIRGLARSKSTWFALLFQLVVIVAAVAFISWQVDQDPPEATRLAVAGVPAEPFEDAGAQADEVADRAAAEQQVRDGEADAAVVGTDTGWDLLANGTPSPTVAALVAIVADEYSTAQALDAFGLSADEFAAAAPDTEITTVDLTEPQAGSESGPEEESEGSSRSAAELARLVTALGVTLLLMVTVIFFCVKVGNRVATEKDSHVVELLLTTVRPFDFLLGKILGNFAMAFISGAIVIAVTAGALALSGVTDAVPFDWSILPLMLIPFSLSLLFFSTLYAAAGAMVKRLEDLEATQVPILILLIASLYVPFFGWSATDQTWMQVLSWIPPFSIFSAPISYAAGDMPPLQLAASLAVSLVASLAVTWLAARIYRGTILNNGSKFSWGRALRA